MISFPLNSTLKNYKSYNFSDSSYNSDTIKNMIEHYWTDIDSLTYGMISFTNYSNSWFGTYYKFNDTNGVITANGISIDYPSLRGTLSNSTWYWNSFVLN